MPKRCSTCGCEYSCEVLIATKGSKRGAQGLDKNDGGALCTCQHPLRDHEEEGASSGGSLIAVRSPPSPSPEQERAKKKRKIESETTWKHVEPLFNALISDEYGGINDSALSDPARLFSLPFPSIPTPNEPPERFPLTSDRKFQYMGRLAFKQVLNALKTHLGGDISVYGSEGYGKSFILAALVCFLIRDSMEYRQKVAAESDAAASASASASTACVHPYRLGNMNQGRLPRIVYIANCATLLDRPEVSLLSALTLAYADDADAVSEIKELETMKHIETFTATRGGSEEIIFVLDQHNALDATKDMSNDDASNASQIKHAVNRIRYGHMSIIGSSPNSARAKVISSSISSQSGILSIYLYGGLISKDDPSNLLEWNAWKSHFASRLPEMDAQQQSKMEFWTGTVPLYLYLLITATDELRETVKQRDVNDAESCSVIAATKAGKSPAEAAQAGQDARAIAAAKSATPLFEEVWPGKVGEKFAAQMDNISTFAAEMLERSSLAWNDYQEFIDLAMNDRMAMHLRKLYDHRYFYVTHGRAHCVCGLIAECAALDLTRRLKDHFLSNAREHLAYAQGSPSVKGFFLEQIMIAAINKNGISVYLPTRTGAGVDGPVTGVAIKPTALKHFHSAAEYQSITVPDEVTLWVPYVFNYTGVNAVLRIKPRALGATVSTNWQRYLQVNQRWVTVGIQITMSAGSHPFAKINFFTENAGCGGVLFQFTWVMPKATLTLVKADTQVAAAQQSKRSRKESVVSHHMNAPKH